MQIRKAVYSRQVTLTVFVCAIAAMIMFGCGEPNNVEPGDTSDAYRILGQAETWGNPFDLTIAGDYVYISERYAGVSIFDISNPNSPVRIDTLIELTEFGAAEEIAYNEEWDALLVNLTGQGVTLLWMDSLGTQEQTISWGIGELTDLLVTIREDSVQSTFDDQMHLSSMMQVIMSIPLDGVAVNKDVLYIDSLAFGDPYIKEWHYEAPDIEIDGLQYLTRPPEGLDFVAGADTIAAAIGELGVAIASLDRSVAPDGQWLSQVDTPGNATNLVYSDGYIYAADGGMGLAVIDATNAMSLEYVTGWRTDGLDHATEVAVRGNRLALVDEYDGVYLMDVTDPSNPEYKDMIEVRGCKRAKFLDDTTLLIISETEGLQTVRLLF